MLRLKKAKTEDSSCKLHIKRYCKLKKNQNMIQHFAKVILRLISTKNTSEFFLKYYTHNTYDDYRITIDK